MIARKSVCDYMLEAKKTKNIKLVSKAWQNGS
jgi:hypothetical protein